MNKDEKAKAFRTFKREFEARFGHLVNDVATTRTKLEDMLVHLEASVLREHDDDIEGLIKPRPDV